MENLPKIARDRLQVSGGEKHPDADLLTAFAEHSLTPLERDRIVEHLSRCSECRKVVVLAMPDAERADQPQPTKSAPRSWANWFSLPVLRWGALAACLTVVAAAVLLRYPKQSQMVFEGKIQQTQPAMTSSAPAAQATPSARIDEISPGRDGANLQAVPENNALAKKRDKPAGQEADALKGIENRRAVAAAEESDAKDLPNASSGAAPVPTPEPRAKQAFAAPSAPAPFPAARKPSSESGDRDKLLPQTMDQAVEVRAAPKSNPQQGRLNELEKKQEADVSLRAQTAVSVPSNHSETAARRTSANDLNVAEWSLSGTGVPQRSFDHGKSWQEVEVGNHAAFRAFSTVQSDIWLAGIGGLLYHSSDGGNHWTQVIPSAGGINLASDINHIEFADTQHGELTTANGETWMTSNGGSSWVKK
jgi:hypothetical protein